MTKMAWSYSRLSDFENCRLLFQHKYILKTIKFVENEAMRRGSEVHKQIERNVVRESHAKDQVGDSVVMGVAPMVTAFVANHQEVLMEEELAFTVGLKSVSWFDKKVWFRAKMDLVGIVNPFSIYADHIASVLDWKTGQYRPNKDQLKIYNMATMLKWQSTKRVSSALVFVDQKRSGPPLISTRHDLPGLIDEFSDRTEAIQIAVERDMWPATPCFQCRWCGVQDCKYCKR